MPVDSLKYVNEKEAIETLLNSDDFLTWCESGTSYDVPAYLEEYLQDLRVDYPRK